MKRLKEMIMKRSPLTPIDGVLVMKLDDPLQPIRLLDPEEAIDDLPFYEYSLKFTTSYSLSSDLNPELLLNQIYEMFKEWMGHSVGLSRDVRSVRIRSFAVTMKENNLVSSWNYQDEDIASHALSIVKKLIN